EDVIYISYETEKLTLMPRVGETLALRFNGVTERDVELVGISQRPFEPAAYMPYAAFERATGQVGLANRLVVYMAGDDTTRQKDALDALIARYEAAEMPILNAETAATHRENFRAQFNILV